MIKPVQCSDQDLFNKNQVEPFEANDTWDWTSEWLLKVSVPKSKFIYFTTSLNLSDILEALSLLQADPLLHSTAGQTERENMPSKYPQVSTARQLSWPGTVEIAQTPSRFGLGLECVAVSAAPRAKPEHKDTGMNFAA